MEQASGLAGLCLIILSQFMPLLIKAKVFYRYYTKKYNV